MKAWLRRSVKSYKMLVFLSIVIGLLSIEYIVLESVTENTLKTSRELERNLRKLRINETEDALQQLSNEIDRVNLPKMQSKEARNYLLEVLEEFRRRYDARVKKQITESESSFVVEIEFTYIPEEPEDVIQLLSYMKKSISPIFNVTGVDFRYNKNIRSVVIEVEMIQPFVGGKYVY